MAFDPKDHMITVQGGKKYLPVAARLVWLRELHPEWGVSTEVVHMDLRSLPGSSERPEGAELNLTLNIGDPCRTPDNRPARYIGDGLCATLMGGIVGVMDACPPAGGESQEALPDTSKVATLVRKTAHLRWISNAVN